jgi:hypothetical protein
MRVLDTAEHIDVDTASPEQMRAVAQRYRNEAAAVAQRYQWAAKYAAPPPAPERSLTDLVPDREAPTAEQIEERQRMVRQARAMVQIEIELEKEAAAADAAKADAEQAAARAARAFRPSSLQRILRHRQ